MESAKAKPMYRYLLILTICSTMGLQAWRTLFDNYAVHVAGLEGSHIGVIQSVREIPGFLTILAIYLMLLIKEHRLSAASIITLGLGVGPDRPVSILCRPDAHHHDHEFRVPFL